jgi:hypothetical protein
MIGDPAPPQSISALGLGRDIEFTVDLTTTELQQILDGLRGADPAATSTAPTDEREIP